MLKCVSSRVLGPVKAFSVLFTFLIHIYLFALRHLLSKVSVHSYSQMLLKKDSLMLDYLQ